MEAHKKQDLEILGIVVAIVVGLLPSILQLLGIVKNSRLGWGILTLCFFAASFLLFKLSTFHRWPARLIWVFTLVTFIAIAFSVWKSVQRSNGREDQQKGKESTNPSEERKASDLAPANDTSRKVTRSGGSAKLGVKHFVGHIASSVPQPQPQSQQAPTPPISSDHGIVNLAPNLGTQTVEDKRVYGEPKPPPNIEWHAVPVEGNVDGTSATWNVLLTVKEEFYDPGFAVICDKPCEDVIASSPGAVDTRSQRLTGQFGTGIHFTNPYRMKAGTEVHILMRSLSGEPIRIVTVSTATFD